MQRAVYVRFCFQIIGVAIVSFILLHVGWLVKNRIKKYRREKLRPLIYIYLGIFVFLAFPLAINAIITNKWYYYIPLQSDMSSKEWFAFWGSYISSLVAILLGWVAYQQTELSNNQNKQSQEQQEQISQLNKIVNSYQLKPKIGIRSLCVEVYYKPLREEVVRWKIEDLFFAYYGIEKHVEGKKFIILTFDVIQEGIVPTTHYNIIKIKWEVANKSFNIKMKSSSHLQITDKLVIIIDEEDCHTEDINDLDDLFDTIATHITYNDHKLKGYGRSVLTVDLQLYNEMTETRFCSIISRINSEKIETSATTVQTVPYIEWEEK